MKKSMGTAVWRFAQAEARKVDATDDTDLGEEALQRAARIEYAIKAAQAQAVDSKHLAIDSPGFLGGLLVR
ncbi:unnamed protein product [Cladocopium goreaui]|uniref:Uncharacterized protein n=1 Tax=Cladocopium goreaui TaxID=2562237 RepID=A0A9P1CYM5_9DINO|nr:unnamed protein product [Cladocopium goreaui]